LKKGDEYISVERKEWEQHPKRLPGSNNGVGREKGMLVDQNNMMQQGLFL
jgi:hypothetical protein